MDAVTATLAEEQSALEAVRNLDRTLRNKGETALEAYDRMHAEKSTEEQTQETDACGIYGAYEESQTQSPEEYQMQSPEESQMQSPSEIQTQSLEGQNPY